MAPRYPLVHEQPFFTEGHWKRVLRAPVPERVYEPGALHKTRDYGLTLLRLPAFPSAGREILDQYIEAFRRVLAHAGEIRAASA
jgi:hypothetical protein